jgi:hypothetical protein
VAFAMSFAAFSGCSFGKWDYVHGIDVVPDAGGERERVDYDPVDARTRSPLVADAFDRAARGESASIRGRDASSAAGYLADKFGESWMGLEYVRGNASYILYVMVE